jgi:hypothetical protein
MVIALNLRCSLEYITFTTCLYILQEILPGGGLFR